jgi:hypothetical protein
MLPETGAFWSQGRERLPADRALVASMAHLVFD